MEPLAFLKFWTPTNSKTTINETNINPNPNLTYREHEQSNEEEEEEEEEEEDSFFELELTVPNDFETTKHNVNTTKDNTTTINTELENKQINDQNTLRKVNPLVDFFAKDNKQFLYKRKILPIEPSSRPPQSPISLLKSAPKFRVFFMFRKTKSSSSSLSAAKTGETEHRKVHVGGGGNSNSNTNAAQNLFTLKFKIKDVQPIFARVNSSRKKENFLSDDSSSRRFSKDVLHKYLGLVKPLYVKVSKRNSEKIKVSEGLVKPSPEVRPESLWRRDKDMHGKKADGFKVVCRHLGKSKSSSSTAASAVIGVSSQARRDDSLVQQHDGIQSAILHCKRSFNSSRDFSHLSRSVSNTCQEKLIDSARNSNSSSNEGDGWIHEKLQLKA